jgi:hypothetical protein
VTTEGKDQVTSGNSCDPVGNCATGTVTDTFACLMKQGSSGGPVVISGQARGTNETEDPRLFVEGEMRPSLFGRNACRDFAKLTGFLC